MAPKSNAHMWLVEPLMDDPSFIEKPMFGCRACYLHGLLVLVLADGEQPWNGLLVATSTQHHNAIRVLFPELAPHEVLGKWLYLSAERNDFEQVAQNIVKAVARPSELFGVVPREQTRKSKAKRSR